MGLQTTIVGCGAVAQRLYRKPLQQLEKHGLLQVGALVDPIVDHTRALLAFFPKAKVFCDFIDALNASAYDLTLILSPAHLHCDQTIQALRHDSHVLCEKPMAATTEECARMNAVATKANRVLAIGMIRRFFPAYAQLRQILREGRLGRLTAFDYREGHKFEWEVTTPAAFRPRSAGGTGVLFDIGAHVTDYLTWTFGDLEPLAYSDDALAGIESNVSMQVESSVCRGSIRLSWDSPQLNELRVIGELGEAVLRVDRFDGLAVNRSSAFEVQRVIASFPADIERIPRRRLAPQSYSEAIFCQIVQVIRAIELGERPAVDGEAGRRNVSLLESVLRIAGALDAPWLDFAQQNASRRLHWNHPA